MELSIEQALQQGVAAHNEGKLQDAEQLYRVVLGSQPLHPDANHNLGVLAVLAHKTNTALPLFKTALEANPKIEQFWLSYINALVKDNQFKDAKKAIKKAKKKGFNTKKLEALLSQSKVNVDTKEPSQGQLSSLLEHYQNGRYVEAEKLATSITNEFPKHQFGWKVLGIVLKKSGRVSESLVASQRAVQLAPQDANAHYNLANTFTELGRLAEAEASFKQSIALKADFAEAHSNLGNTLQELGRLKEAQESYMQAIALKPDYAEAHSNFGNTLKKAGKLEEAKASYRQSIALAPDYAEAHNNLGITLQKLGILDEAEASYKQAIVLKPDLAEAHNNLGFTLQELGRLGEAEASFKQSIALNPDFADAHYNLANTFKELGRLEEAEASFKQSIALQADFVEAHSNLGNTLQELGRLREAQESYTQALALEPESATAAQNMVKLPVGQLDLKILDLCEKAFFGQSGSVKNQASYYFSQANLLKHKGLIDQSFDEFCKANKFRWKEVGEQFEKRNRAYTENLNRIRQWTPNVPELVEGRLTKLFLLGPSRSGKSSLEHLLNKSSQVKPLYEGISYSGLLKGFVNGKERCEKLVFQGEDELLRQGYTVATSTNPDNIFNADYLIDMLPNTYFLIIKRDLRDVAPEIFINEYAKEQFYSYNPNGISTYLGVYDKLCAVLALKVPDRCITIRFEDIINSAEHTIERISALVFRNFEVGRLDKYITNFTSESLFRDHFSGINKSSKI